MKTDRYTKSVLTVIAVCLVLIVVKQFNVIEPAQASQLNFETAAISSNAASLENAVILEKLDAIYEATNSVQDVRIVEVKVKTGVDLSYAENSVPVRVVSY